jgi:hypothetical protein
MGMQERTGAPVAAAPCPAPASNITAWCLRLILQASGRAEAASAKHGPQPASMRAAPAFRERLSDVEAASISFSKNKWQAARTVGSPDKGPDKAQAAIRGIN